MAPGPGHPGHFPKPPGWVDRPGASRPATAGTGSAAGADRPNPTPPRADIPTFRRGPKPAEPADAPKTGGATDGAAPADDAEAAAEAVEHDIGALAVVQAERDEYLDALKRLQADFENYKKRIARQQIEVKERAAEDLVQLLLPALDNFDLALAHAEGENATGLTQVHRSLLSVLEGAGLERLNPTGEPFDPNQHDAVLHEEGEEGAAAEVSEVMRAGYRWKGRVLRPAMVKVKG